MTAAITTSPVSVETLEQVMVGGDLASLKPEQRVAYYASVCESLGLNPNTRPFEYVKLNGKLTLYARKDATDQLRSLRGVSLNIVSRERLEGDLYVVTARASLPSGRCDESTGVVSLKGKQGEDLANALMKAETKAKRRATLSLCGLGWLDEGEVEAVRDAVRVQVSATGEIAGQPAPRQFAAVPDAVPTPRSGVRQEPDFAAMLDAATSLEELADIGASMKTARLSSEERMALRPRYLEAKARCERMAAVTVVEVVNEDAEP